MEGIRQTSIHQVKIMIWHFCKCFPELAILQRLCNRIQSWTCSEWGCWSSSRSLFQSIFLFWSQGLSCSAHLTAFDVNSINKCWHLGWLLSLYKHWLARHWLIPSFFLLVLLLVLSHLLLLGFIWNFPHQKYRIRKPDTSRFVASFSTSQICSNRDQNYQQWHMCLSNVFNSYSSTIQLLFQWR